MKNVLLYSFSLVLGIMSVLRAAPQSSVSQYGITWTFDHAYETGRFCNGDWWVVGPVTVTAIENDVTAPAYSVKDDSGRTMNGSMLNPSVNTSGGNRQGYDSYDNEITQTYAFRTYDSTLNVGLNLYTGSGNSLVVPVHSSVVSCISLKQSRQRPQLQTAAILTVLDTVPPDGSFRPGYSGTDKTILFNRAHLDYSLLKNLPRPGSTLPLDEMTALAVAPCLDHMTSYYSDYFVPGASMAGYGKSCAEKTGLCALGLNLDWGGNNDSLKEALYIGLVQAGLDRYVSFLNGMTWQPDGGIWQGRKLPILLAGHALLAAHPDGSPGHTVAAAMAGIGSRPSDDPYFAEDAQTFFVTEADIHDPPFALNINAAASRYTAGTVSISSAAPSVVQGSGTVWEDGGSTDPDRVVAGKSMFAVPGDGEEMHADAHAYLIDSVDFTGQRLFLHEPYRGVEGSGLGYEIGDYLYYGHGSGGKREDYTEYTAAWLGRPEWGIRHATNTLYDGVDYDKAYLGTCEGWTRQILAVHIMGLKEAWNHDALFDWMDRYSAIRIYIDSLRLHFTIGTPLPAPLPGIDSCLPGYPVVGPDPHPDPDADWTHWTYYFNDWDRDMWDAYRADYPPVWPDTAVAGAVRSGSNTVPVPQRITLRTNPVINDLIVDAALPVSMQLLTPAGAVVRTVRNTTRMPVSGLAAGIYFVKVVTGTGEQTLRFLKRP